MVSVCLVPGQEYRDTAQGHINFLGIDQVIEPYSTGGTGSPPVKENYPPLHDLLLQARQHHAMAGVAHGGILGKQSTSLADAVLGAVDFWEISNPHSFKKSRCDEEQGAVCKQGRKRSILRNQAGCGLERSSSRMLF
jgi:hypothetical protein